MASRSTTSERTFKTDDMPLAAFLWYLGHQLMDMSWDGDRCAWTFKGNMRTDVDRYRKGQATVQPLTYFGAVTEFKRLVYKDRPTH